MNDNMVPAFPIMLNGEAMGEMQEGDGMTLRDYFASSALKGLLSSEVWALGLTEYAKDKKGEEARIIAESCYEIADAMLEEREK